MAMSVQIEKVFHMNGGVGDCSYAHNSTLSQKSALKLIDPILEECILSMKFMERNTFRIGELGCSSGPNALLPAETIIKSLKAKYSSAGIPVPQFQVFLNDLPCTDFNTLFRALPPSGITEQNDAGGRSYFAAGVPGSFYYRLFPDNSLHFVHSSYSLHWLSQVPSEVLEKNSVTWNKGKISAEGSRAVGEAYFRQFQRDFSAFLKARAKEVVAGGRMVFIFMGRTSPDPNGQCMLSISWELLESSLNDLVSQGLIEEEKVDSFNMPVFCPCCEEVSSEIAREGSFEIQRLELLTKAAMDEVKTEVMGAIRGSPAEREAYGKSYATRLRAVTESLLKFHFGEEVMDSLFQRCGEALVNRLSKIDEFEIQGGYLIMVLERK